MLPSFSGFVVVVVVDSVDVVVDGSFGVGVVVDELFGPGVGVKVVVVSFNGVAGVTVVADELFGGGGFCAGAGGRCGLGTICGGGRGGLAANGRDSPFKDTSSFADTLKSPNKKDNIDKIIIDFQKFDNIVD
uniref:Uncharacterized protein n=1 Tax=Panagrolaimus superbus TaxID=310955 RepID=A0A914YDK2_9BILA